MLYSFWLKRVMQGKTASEEAGLGGRQLAPSHSGAHTEAEGRLARSGNRRGQEEFNTSH